VDPVALALSRADIDTAHHRSFRMSKPLQPITQSHVAAYARDGAVCVRGMFSADWVTRMRAIAERIIIDPAKHGLVGPSQGETMASVCYMSRNDAELRNLILESPAGEIAGRIIGSHEIRLYHDHLFAKFPRSPKLMQWHIDATAWPVTGEMAPNLWIALTRVTAETGRIEFVAGHHRHLVDNNILYGFREGHWSGPCPDFEKQRDNPALRFITWDLEPGDAVLFHPYTPHFSKGNDSPDQFRIALALRLFGDDVRWNPIEGKAHIPDVTDMIPGERPSGPFFPVLWSDDPNWQRGAA
jgi:ectoine hydroxylase-related dioxygenase (phytanoyl-CoA dioxygenase family)